MADFSKTINDSQMLYKDCEIFDDVKALQMESKEFFFAQNFPVSVAELKFYLDTMDYENLSENAKVYYLRIHDFLYEEDNLLPWEGIKFSANVILNPEFYFRTNKDFDWSWNYNYQDHFINMPIKIGAGDLFTIETDFFLSKNKISQHDQKNFTNIFWDVKQMDFMFFDHAYGSFAKTFNNWGTSFHIGKQGKEIGDTLSGSTIYNQNFETNAYGEFAIYSPIVKYTADVVQVSSNRMDNIQNDITTRYMYLHEIDIRFWKKFKLSVLEGSLIANPFEIRFLNPLVFMHQFGGWTDYVTDENYKIYKETNFCAYFCAMLEYMPIRNLRLYGLYSQIEMQMPWERSQDRGRYYPNSIGLQLGGEYFWNLGDNGNLKFRAEGVYTSPYMYIKQTPSSSLYTVRTDMQTKGKIYSWIGTPFGPDTMAGQFETEYDWKKWNFKFDYVFAANGSNNFGIFSQKNGDVYSYYPSVIWYLIKNGKSSESYDDLYKQATDMGLTGVPQYSNDLVFNVNYDITDKMNVGGQINYRLCKNIGNVESKLKQNVEFAFSFRYNIF